MIYLIQIEKIIPGMVGQLNGEPHIDAAVIQKCFDLVEGFYHEDDAKRYRAEKCSREEKFILLEGKLI